MPRLSPLVLTTLLALSPVSTRPATEMSPYHATNISSNWSGYAFQGGPFKGVAGTFTVPKHVGGQGYFSDWIGIDGYSNSDLIQTGIEVDNVGGYFSVQPWWEILPSAEQPITWMTVEPGDVMHASIKLVAKHTWRIDLTDTTRQESFSQTLKYGGPANSAEWIVETPEVAGTISAILPYDTVQFSDMKVDGRAAKLDDVWLEQNKQPQSIPQSVPNAATLMRDGFTSEYVG